MTTTDQEAQRDQTRRRSGGGLDVIVSAEGLHGAIVKAE
jgi:hypothetical protein